MEIRPSRRVQAVGAYAFAEVDKAVERLRERGIDISGPIAADTVFALARRGDFQVVVALYHDQGHIPIKVYSFEKSVSVALGLPFIRTSVDHGTAYGKAGRREGTANPESLKEAIHVAVQMAEARKNQ